VYYYKELYIRKFLGLEIFSHTWQYSLAEVKVAPVPIVLPDRIWLEGVLVMETSPSRPPLTIIVVEDNPLDVYLMRWVLDAHQLRYELQVIENGDYALDVVDQLALQEHLRSPTIVLLDLNLPQLDGKEVLRHIKAIPHGSDIRVVVVTSSSNPTDRRETLALGADAYFVKPYHLNEFMRLGEVIKHVAFGNPPSSPQNN
jgi:CheY-like chemotaxis protein